MTSLKPSRLAPVSPRSSAFTFQSAVHSAHLLSRLDEQRRRDVLCDVTLMVDGRSFRAHRSVLAACSQFFAHTVSSHTGQGAVLTLPPEVTVTGFEPLLKFAYTSKLLFSKDNVIEISHAAAVLGFRDLDKACFDFVLPKFFSATKGSVPFQRWTCCRKKKTERKGQPPKATDGGKDNEDTLQTQDTREKEAKPVSDSPAEREVVQTDTTSVNDERGSEASVPNPNLPPAAGAQSEGAADYSVRCTKYRKFQLARGREACGAGKKLTCPVAVIEDDYKSCVPRAGNCSSRNEPAIASHGQRLPSPNGLGMAGTRAGEMEKAGRRGEVEGEDEERRQAAAVTRGETGETVRPEGPEGPVLWAGVTSRTSPRLLAEPQGLILNHCPPASGEARPLTGSAGREAIAKEVNEDRGAGTEESLSIHPKAEGGDASERGTADVEMDRDCRDGGRGAERVEGTVPEEERKTGGRRGRRVEAEATGRPAEGQRSHTSPAPPALPALPGGTAAASDPGIGPEVQGLSLDWLQEHQLLLDSRATSACPFLQELDPPRRGTETWESKLSECDGASQAAKSPCVSSLNSGEDGDSEDFDTESLSERAKQVQLPFSVEWIVNLSRNEFQLMLKQQPLTHDQLSFAHDMRRRSKNRVAARRCRKRKLDCLYNLECEINKLRTEREKLVLEKSELHQMKLTTWHSVSALCQRVCREANLRPEQLQVLAKYTSLDCPLSTLVPYMDSLLAGPSGPSGHPAVVHRASPESPGTGGTPR